MALMPESWLNIPMVIARKIGKRYFQLKSGSAFSKLSRWMEVTISCSSFSGSSAPHFLQHFPRFRDPLLRHQPARALRDAEQHHEKQHGRECGYAELPAPLRPAKTLPRD